MDERRRELESRQDELRLELMMDDYARKLGTQARDEAEAAFADGKLEIPQALDDACRAMIDDAPEAKPAKKPTRTFARYALVAAATAALMLGSLIIAQALGTNVIGRIATWTDSVLMFRADSAFSFEEEPELLEDPTGIEPKNEIQRGLIFLHMPVRLAPTWVPDGFKLQSTQVTNNEVGKRVAAGFADESGKVIMIFITEAEEPWDFSYEKNETEPIEYISNGRRFYLFENLPGWVGAWDDGKYSVTITNVNTQEELKKIIDSME